MSTVLSEEAEYLASIIISMSEQATNPVLLSLKDQQAFTANTKYNLPALNSNNFGLRIFYHQHVHPSKSELEHGHFHLFVRNNGIKDWQHLIAIVMDRQGQAIEFSTVNQWVTDSQWVEQNNLESLFQQLQQQDPDSLLISWFIAILCLYKNEITQLIRKRDLHLSDINESSAINDILKNREFYTLSSLKIDLKQKLTQQ